MRFRYVLLFMLLLILASTSVLAVSMDTVLSSMDTALAVINYIDSLPDSAELYFEELESGQVKLYFDVTDNIDIFYTTDGSAVTEDSTQYHTPVIVDVGTEFRWLTCYLNSGETARSNITIERNDDPVLNIENNAQLGTLIILEDSNLLSSPPIYYSIIDSSEFSHAGQYQLKTTLNWSEFTSPIALSDIPYENFVIAYVVPATEFKLSSNVLYQEFKTKKGACFNYVFYDKGFYSEGWRYIEICPIVQNGEFGPLGFAIGSDNVEIGGGQINTTMIVSSLSNSHSTRNGSPYAAQVADRLVYGGKEDWYLPSRDELKMAKEKFPELFSIMSDYWTSTERNEDKAYTLRWNRNKDSNLAYFVVRRF